MVSGGAPPSWLRAHLRQAERVRALLDQDVAPLAPNSRFDDDDNDDDDDDAPARSVPPPRAPVRPSASAALCPTCGLCTDHQRCERCGTDMREALSLWQQAGARASEQQQLASHFEGVLMHAWRAREDGSQSADDPTGSIDVSEVAATLPCSTPAHCDGEPCAVCLRELRSVSAAADCDPSGAADEDSVVLPPCFHRFHRACVRSWWQTRPAAVPCCPLCRTAVAC